MDREELYKEARHKFDAHFGCAPAVAAYAPGRVEILGNHTDYNDGLVLSAAINNGMCFLLAPTDGNACRLVAGDLMQEVTFDAAEPAVNPSELWPNYVIGVAAGLRDRGDRVPGFLGLFFGDVPTGAGLSSSAALEISAGLALCRLAGVDPDRLELARIAQRAEHEFVGVRCGLLDQISSLYGRPDALVLTDFRSLSIETVLVEGDACFLVINTHARRELVEGEYNRRRQECEAAARYFATVLEHPVTALRDVHSAELAQHGGAMDKTVAARAAHIIGENERVAAGRAALAKCDLAAFGELMFTSHESSRVNFENSCPELDFIVERCRAIPGVLGARLSGGGFGGSAVILVHARDTEIVRHALETAFARQFNARCEGHVIRPSQGAELLDQRNG